LNTSFFFSHFEGLVKIWLSRRTYFVWGADASPARLIYDNAERQIDFSMKNIGNDFPSVIPAVVFLGFRPVTGGNPI
jgi:hypothetical protein